MRIPGLGGKVMSKVGVDAVLMAGGEIYTALDRGTIDATEWVGPYHDLRLGLYRAAKYYYYPGWQEPGPALELIVNRKHWESLDAELQAIIEHAAAAYNVWMLSEFQARNLEALHTLQNKYHVELLPFPDDVLRELHAKTGEVLDEEGKDDKLFTRVRQAYEGFRKNIDAWNAVSEAAYARAVKL